MDKAKIVFVNPPLSAQDRYGLKTMVGGQTPPLGLACLAAMTRKEGYGTAIIDGTAMGWSNRKIVNEIIKNKYKYVGITGATIAYDQMAKLAEALKKANPKTVILVGGAHLTGAPEESMQRCKYFDIGVIGEADYTIVELLEKLEKRISVSGVKGLIIRQNGKLVRTAKRPPIMDLDKLPMLAWDLLPSLATYYRPPLHTVLKMPAALLVASRGCPGQCTFCDRSVFGNTLRAYSAEYTFKLIKDLYDNYGIREIQLRDDNFLAFPKRLIELCGIIKREGLDITWTCAGRVDMINPKLLKVMKEVGCWQIWYGVESGSQRILKILNKKTNLGQIEKAIKMTKDAGINPCGFFILGSPGETKKTLQETINFAIKLPLTDAHFSYMTPFPGTVIYKQANILGKFDNDWKKFHGWFPVFVPNGLKASDLEYFSKKAFRKFYFRPRIIWGYLKKINSWENFKLYWNGFLGLIEMLTKRSMA